MSHGEDLFQQKEEAAAVRIQVPVIQVASDGRLEQDHCANHHCFTASFVWRQCRGDWQNNATAFELWSCAGGHAPHKLPSPECILSRA